MESTPGGIAVKFNALGTGQDLVDREKKLLRITLFIAENSRIGNLRPCWPVLRGRPGAGRLPKSCY